MNPTRTDWDRRVHARYEGMEIVRYDRSGKWYLEPTHPTLKRQHVTIDQAVDAALWASTQPEGTVTFGLPGGTTFDRRFQTRTVRKAASS